MYDIDIKKISFIQTSKVGC